MFFVSRSDLDKRIRLMRRRLHELGISDDLRGWSWDRPPVEPPYDDLYVSVSELAGRYCEVLRDIYLRRVLKIPVPFNIKLFDGLVLHRTASEALTYVKKVLYSRGVMSGADLVEELLPKAGEVCEKALRAGLRLGRPSDEELEASRLKALRLFRFLVIQAGSQLDLVLSKFPHAELDSVISQAVPPIVERRVDGSLIGLSKELAVDVYMPAYAIIDLKTGEIRPFHKYALAGYALALEADEEIEVNYGLIIYLRVRPDRPHVVVRIRSVLIDDAIRKEFLDIRDEAMRIISNGSDPGMPARCPSYCPYWSVCHGGEAG